MFLAFNVMLGNAIMQSMDVRMMWGLQEHDMQILHLLHAYPD